MLKFYFFSLFVIMFSSSISYTHTVLDQINPKSGDILLNSPKEIKMIFKSKVKLIKLNMEKKLENGKKKNKNYFQNISKEKTFMIFSDTHTIKLPNLDSGQYIFKWRGISDDGHIIKGKSTFEIK